MRTWRCDDKMKKKEKERKRKKKKKREKKRRRKISNVELRVLKIR